MTSTSARQTWCGRQPGRWPPNGMQHEQQGSAPDAFTPLGAMKKGLQAITGLTLLAAFAEALILVRIRIDAVPLAALLESVALLLGAFVALAQTAFVRQLRQWAVASPGVAAGLPFLLLIPYLIFGLGTHT